MSKALKVVGVIVAVVAVVATAGAAIPGLAAALGTTAATLTTIAAVASLASVAIGLAQMAIGPPGGLGFSSQGNPLQFTTNPQSGLPYPIGRTRMSGVRLHGETYDALAYKSEGKDDVLSFAALLGAGGPMDSIETFRADKEVVTFDPSTGMAIGKYADYMAQKVSLGLIGASALALSFGGGGFPGWTAAHKLSGISHALWDLRYDEKGEKYGAGVPEPEWIGKWVKIYDPRKDSTYPGGSGAHRALNEATYEWSANPALHALTWALGRWQNGKRTLGIGAPVANIRVADFVEAANVADANGWTCGGVEWSTDSKWTILKRILQAGGAEPTMTAAMIGCRVMAPVVSIATVEAADLLDSFSFATTRSRRDRFNTVRPRYRSEDHEFEIITGSAVSVPAYVTDDGGPRTKEIDFPLVQHEVGHDGNKQAGELAAYEIVNSREAGPWTFTTGPKFFAIKSGDCITLNVPDEGIANQPCIVREVRRDPASLQFTFTVETETTEKHDFALGKTTTPPLTWSPTPPDLTPPIPSAALWALTTTTTGGGVPALVIQGACEFPGADKVLLQYRKVGVPAWLTAGDHEASQPVNTVLNGVEPATQYEAQVAYRSGNRTGGWLALGPVTTPSSVLTDFNEQNNRNDDTIPAPTIATGGTAVDHSLNDNGSANVSFEWSWGGDEGTIDGFEVVAIGRTSSSSYTIGGDTQNESHIYVPAAVRNRLLIGVNPVDYYTFYVRAYRKVDEDIDAGGVLKSPWVKPSRTEENPYRPSSQIALDGNLLIQGLDASEIVDGIANYNTRNDRNSTAVVLPIVPTSGTAVDHTINTDGSADISFEWNWAGTESDIDYFDVAMVARTSSSAYTIGSNPAIETHFSLLPSDRSHIFSGMAANLYYTFAVRARRIVDPDIDASGFKASAWVKATGSGENPYQPSANVAFLGDVAGTISTLPRMIAPADFDVLRRWNGAQISGQLPVSMKFTRMLGETDVSSGSTWSIDLDEGVTVSISSSGLATITSVDATRSSYFVAKSVYQGVSEKHMIRIEDVPLPPPVGTSTYTTISGDTNGKTITNTTYGTTPLFDPVVCKAGPNGEIECFFSYFVAASNSSGVATFKAQYRAVGGGSWIDVAAGAATSESYNADYPEYSAGGAAGTVTGLTPDTEYEFQLLAFKSGAASSMLARPAGPAVLFGN